MSETIEFDGLCLFEGMTSISALIKAAENFAEARRIVKVFYDESKSSSKYSQIKFLSHRAEALGFQLIPVTTEYIDSISSGKTHGGFVAVCEQRNYPSLSDDNINPNGIYYILDGIEDPFNFGYTVRSLYASGADGIVLPFRNWMESTAVVSRSSAGTSELINTYVQDTSDAVKFFKSHGFRVACANITDSRSIYDADITAPIVFIIGGEKRGISGNVLKLADINIRLDYASDFKGSLPTSSAAAIISFEAAKRNNRF